RPRPRHRCPPAPQGPGPGLSEAESILGMAEALAAGAKCLDDLEVARADRVQEELRGFGVPPPQTAGRFLRRFCLGHIGQLTKALGSVLLRALSLVGIGEGGHARLISAIPTPRTCCRMPADWRTWQPWAAPGSPDGSGTPCH